MISSTRLLPSLAVCLWSLLAVDAFSVPLRNGNSVGGWTSQRLQQQQQQPWTCFMTAAASNDDTDADADADDSNVDTEPVVEDAAAVKEETTQEEEEVAVQEPEEDPELTALKEQIAQLEKELKHKRQQVALTVDRADEFTDAGYARKVAEMEQMQRTRRMLQSSDGNSATASLLMEFLPVWDKLTALRILHSEDDFGKQYNALPGAIISSFNAMGVVDFAVDAGVAVDLRRVRVVETQASDDVAADTVLRAVAGGLELDGNVIRKAEVVASSGPVVVADAADADATEDEASQEEASE